MPLTPVLRRAVLAAAFLVLGLAGPGLAHRVNVFAYAEGDTVHVEGSFSKSDRVKAGRVEVRDAATGKVYLAGKTDDQGAFSFQVPPEAKAAKADLKVVLVAGEGHQNDTLVRAVEYLPDPSACSEPVDPAALSNEVDPAVAPPLPATAAPAASAAPAAPAASVPFLDAATLRDLCASSAETAVEKKIAPVRRMLIDEKEKGPGPVQIVGGIGYLVGLAGIVAYARSRRGRPGA